MGCDIHAVIEINPFVEKGENEEDILWHGVVVIEIDREYNFFSLLAGVRQSSKDFDPIKPLAGIPNPHSFTYDGLLEIWEGDGYSHSYYTFEELKISKYYNYYKNHLFFKIMEMLTKDYGTNSTRIVFFFDN